MINKLANIWRNNNRAEEAQELRDLLETVDVNRMPRHVAIIMDGNGRWAQRQGLIRSIGHRAGVESLREVVRLCCQLGIKVLTLYAFSTENWKRPQEEIVVLMDLLVEYLRKEVKELHEEGVYINPIGGIKDLPQPAVKALEDAVKLTANNSRLILNVALNYGGRTEILDAARAVAAGVEKGLYRADQIDAELFSSHLYTAGLPDPDLLIRPAGDFRISNFLLWQLAYTEFWFTDALWPEFGPSHFLKALIDYQQRDRRFGGLNQANKK